MDEEYEDFFDESEEIIEPSIVQQEETNRSDSKYKNIDALERYTIKCLLTSQTIISRYIDKIKASYFEIRVHKIIFKMINSYYKELGFKIPVDEISLRLEDILPKNGIEDKNLQIRTECINLINQLLSEPEINIESATKNITSFIVRRASESALNDLIANITNTESTDSGEAQYFAIEKCIAKIRESTNVQSVNSEPYNLADITKISEIKKEGFGEDGTSIKLFMDSLNDTLTAQGVNRGALVCIMAPPGTGKTTFLINQGIYSAKQGLNVCHCFIGDMEKMDGLIKYYSVFRDNRYRMIDILNITLRKKIMALKKLLSKPGNNEIQKRYNEELERYEKQLKDNEIVNTSLKADVKLWPLTSKELVRMENDTLQATLQADSDYLAIAKNVDLNVFPVGDLSMDALREEIYNWQKERKKHYDVIIIDYDANLKQPADNLYESGGIIYDQAKNLAQVNKSVVFMASQPSKAFWKNELIPLEAAAESSKKQMIIDLLITIGRPEGVNSGIRKIYVPKNRRGNENEILCCKMNGETGLMYEILQEEYDKLKKEGYDPTHIISANGMYGNKGKKKEAVQEEPPQEAGPLEGFNQIK